MPGKSQTIKPGNPATLDGSASYDVCPVSEYAVIMSWRWEIDDEGPVIRTGEQVQYTFQSSGLHTVKLIVTDMAGNVGENTTTIYMGDTVAPEVDAGPDFYADEDVLVFWNATLCTDDDPTFFDTADFNWTFIDGTPKELTGVYPSYIFTEPGDYQILLTVTDFSGNTANDTVIAHINDVTAPHANAGEDFIDL